MFYCWPAAARKGHVVPAGGFAYAVWSYCVLLCGIVGLRQQGRVILSLPGASLTLIGPTVSYCVVLLACGSKEGLLIFRLRGALTLFGPIVCC
jgi:hypothetical protein